jgi:hypothetical protein
MRGIPRKLERNGVSRISGKFTQEVLNAGAKFPRPRRSQSMLKRVISHPLLAGTGLGSHALYSVPSVCRNLTGGGHFILQPLAG